MASSHTSCIFEVLQCLLCCEEETPGGSYDRSRPFPSRPLIAFFSRISTTITYYLQSRSSSSPSATTAARYRNPHPPSSSPSTTTDQSPPSSVSGASASITTATNSSNRSRPLINPSATLQIRRRHRPRPPDSSSIGVQIRVVIEEDRPPPPPETRIPANAGDYFMGSGLEQLIQQLAENDPNRYGTPPASKCAIETLPTIKINNEILDSEMNQCAVCQDGLEKDMEVKQMPCKHMYHSDCLLPWLEMHNSCPICRYELPTDDADYESNRRRGRAGTGRE